MARLFISYKHDEEAYAFALRQWLLEAQHWAEKDIFVDKDHLSAGKEWEPTLLAEAERAEVMLFLASEASINANAFCAKELAAAKGQILTVTIKGLANNDARLFAILPKHATARQIEALDQQPVEGVDYVSPSDNTRGTIGLNRRQVESIGATLRDLGVAPDSFNWTPRDDGPFPGLLPLQEGDEAIFCGRDLDIRDGQKALDDLRGSVTQKALLIEAPSGAGKSSFLRAGLWQRLRRSAAFTPLAIIRSEKGAVGNPKWGLVTGLFDTLNKARVLKERLPLSRSDVAARVNTDLPDLFAAIAEADAAGGPPRTLLLGIDQAEEMTGLAPDDAAELEGLLRLILSMPPPPDIRLVLTVRDDSIDATRERLIALGLAPEAIATWRLHRLPRTRLRDVITGPATAAAQAGWPLQLKGKLVEELAQAAAETSGEGGDALPILAVALQRLIVEHRTPTGEITLPASEAKSFLHGAVKAAVDAALTAAEAAEDDLRRLIIPRLATWDSQTGGEGVAKRVVASAERLFEGDRNVLRPLADALVTQRLLTSSQTEVGTIYEVAHEALLRVAPLAHLIFQRREKFELQRVLLGEARDWVASGEATGRLGRQGERLKDAQALLGDDDFGLELRQDNTHVTLYLAACAAEQQALIERETAREREKQQAELAAANARVDAHRRVAKRTRAGATVAIVLAFLATAAGWFAWERGQREAVQRKEAQTLASRWLADTAASLTANPLGGDAATAMLLALEGLPDKSASVDRPLVVEAQFQLDRTLRLTKEQAVLAGHGGAVTSAAYSPDGTAIVTASADKSALVWVKGNAGWREAGQLAGHDGVVTSAAWSPDGKTVITTSADKTARLWVRNGASWREVDRFAGHDNWVQNAAWRSDGEAIVIAAGNTARVWVRERAAFFRAVGELIGHGGEVTSAAWSPDGTSIVTASADKTARVWERDGARWREAGRLDGHCPAEIDYENHYCGVTSAAWSPDGTKVVTASDDRTARVWSRDGGGWRAVVLAGHGGRVNSVAFNSNGTAIVTASADRTARVWVRDHGGWREEGRFAGHCPPEFEYRNSDCGVTGAVWSPDGASIVTASADRTARLWVRAGAGWHAHLLRENNSKSIRNAAWRPDGTAIVTVSADKAAQVWVKDGVGWRADGALLEPEHSVVDAAWSPNGTAIVTASNDKTARVWVRDSAGWRAIGRLTGHDGAVTSAVWSPDGAEIVTVSADTTARVWAKRGMDWHETGRLADPNAAVTSAAWSPDATAIAVGSTSKTAWVWVRNEASWRKAEPLSGHGDPVFINTWSKSGAILTTSTDLTVRVWVKEATQWREAGRLEDHDPASASLSPDGTAIAITSQRPTHAVRLWVREVDNWRETGQLVGHDGTVHSAAWRADGEAIVTTSADKSARVWVRDGGVWRESARLIGHDGGIDGGEWRPGPADADGTSLILTVSGDKTASIWRIATTTQALVDAAKALVSRCLTPAQRRQYSLSEAPPLWCVERRLWPYHSVAWQNWFASRKAGRNLPSPDPAVIETLIAEGKKLIAAGIDNEAETKFTQAQARDPTMALTITETKALAWFKRGEVKLDQAGTLTDAAAALANCKAALFDFDRALASFGSLVAEKTDQNRRRELVLLRGRALYCLSNFASATTVFREAVQLGHEDAGYWQLWATKQLGMELWSSDKKIEALLLMWTNLLDLPADVRNKLLWVEDRAAWEGIIARLYVEMPRTATQPPPTLCDILAGHPLDPLRVATGVDFDALDPPTTAIDACNAALAAAPDQPRFHFQRGRSHDRAARLAETRGDRNAARAADAAAIADYRAATDKGYYMAFRNLAFNYREGHGVGVDPTEADNLWKQALNAIFACCWEPVARLLLERSKEPAAIAPYDTSAVTRVVATLTPWAAALGSPEAQRLRDELVAAGLIAPSAVLPPAQFTKIPPWFDDSKN